MGVIPPYKSDRMNSTCRCGSKCKAEKVNESNLSEKLKTAQ